MLIVISEKALLLVTGTGHHTGYWYAKHSEVITSSQGNQICPGLDYPMKISDGSGDVIGDKPLVCGGEDSMPFSLRTQKNRLSSCYLFDGREWKFHTNLKTARSSSKGIALNDKTLWIVGGYGNSGSLASTELVHLDKTVEAGPELQQGVSSFCVMSHQNTILITGGYQYKIGQKSNSVMIYDKSDIFHEPKVGSPMLKSRKQHACTIFNSIGHDNRPVAIIAGGFQSDAELWDYTQQDSKWIQSKKTTPLLF